MSALEFVAKLYGLIPPNSFPLQGNPENQKKEFAEPDLQSGVGLQALADKYYDKQESLGLLLEETNQGRFPLISLRGYREDGSPAGYHIFVVGTKSGELQLIDPARQQIVVDTTKDLETVIERNSIRDSRWDRETIHILTLHPKIKKG